MATRYPIAVTRDLERSEEMDWLSRARNERYGLVASSKAMRFKPHAIDIRVSVDPVHYFLNDRDDTRSSYYLEDAATEFQVQGLELDWVCVAWCGDFRSTAHDGITTIFAAIAGATSQTRRIAFIYATLTEFCSRARGKAWLFSFRLVTARSYALATFYDSTFHLSELGIPNIA